ncbi:MAG: hypothetical protein NTZ69_01775 [Bacteroidia bacterium]|nr:hypothetical protein [Bacteroidia bacterium]
MKKQDLLIAYLKELPREEPSGNFTQMVMNRVQLETIKSPVVYQSLISKEVWLKVIVVSGLLLLGAVILYFYLPGGTNSTSYLTLPKIDFSILFKPFLVFTQALNKISITFLGVLIAIASLLLVDQLYTRFANR